MYLTQAGQQDVKSGRTPLLAVFLLINSFASSTIVRSAAKVVSYILLKPSSRSAFTN